VNGKGYGKYGVSFITPEQMELEIHSLLAEYSNQHGQILDPPIPIDEITEIYLELALEFVDTKKLFGVDGVFGALWVEEQRVGIDHSLEPESNPKMLGRYHFTLAHEVGHWRLHRRKFQKRVVTQPSLDGHLKIFGNQYRYSNSCRDVSVRLPQDSVALHAAVAARQFRSLSTDFVAKVFRTDDSLMTTCIEVDVSPYRQVVVNGWTLHVSERLIRSMVQARVSMLPRETGGVLLGSIDLARKLIYVVDSVSAPPDSQYSETSYLRGCEGLVESLEIIRLQTGGQLEYVGEWHSHPGASTRPSKHDGQLFAWLVQHRLMDGIPALMAIVGEDSSRWLVKQFSKSKEMKHG